MLNSPALSLNRLLPPRDCPGAADGRVAITKIADHSELSVAGPTHPGKKRRVPLITWLEVFPKRVMISPKCLYGN